VSNTENGDDVQKERVICGWLTTTHCAEEFEEYLMRTRELCAKWIRKIVNDIDRSCRAGREYGFTLLFLIFHALFSTIFSLLLGLLILIFVEPSFKCSVIVLIYLSTSLGKETAKELFQFSSQDCNFSATSKQGTLIQKRKCFEPFLRQHTICKQLS